MVFSRHDLLVVCGILALIVGCGGGTTGTGAGGASTSSTGAGGASTSTGTTGAGGASTSATTSTSTTGAGGATPGHIITTCFKPDKMKCALVADSDQVHLDAQNSVCTSEGGTPAPHCTSTNLIGCCIVVDIGTCYYEMQAAAMAQAACASFSGKWSTMAP